MLILNIVTKHITIKNEELTLTNQRAIYWKREEALILSDIHIGKTAHFRRHGIPVPDAILQKDLARLKSLIGYFKVHRLLIVGDLFHAESNIDVQTFKKWLAQFEGVKLILIKGNHDRLSKSLMDDFNIQIETELIIEPFTFIHEYSEEQHDAFIISGHTHPGVLLRGNGRQRLKLPCYQVTNNGMILPAFSLFTGLNTRTKRLGIISYAFSESGIYRITE
jgi:DNA ligase-associated metallophosphoesterase